MKYALLIYNAPDARDLPEGQLEALIDEYQEIFQSPGVIDGQQLQLPGSATTVRVENGEALLTDGPFVDAKEHLGGLWLVEADDLDAPPHSPRASRPPAWAAPSRCGRRGASGRPLIDQVFRDEWGRVLASLVGFFGDFDLAEEAAQEAFAVAAERWPRDGTPANPGAWLTTTARQPRDRPHAPRSHARREDAAARSAGGGGATRWRRRTFPTSGWS